MEIKSTESLYNAFRVEIEKICTPEILKQLTTIKLIKDDIDVGILSFIRQDEWIYIDALYVIPEYRKKGVGKNAVLNWYDEYKDEEIRLHIVHKNAPAQKFWKSIFELEEIESSFLDTLYRIKKLKPQQNHNSKGDI